MKFDDDARHAPLAKRHQHAPAYDGRGIRGNMVGEDHVERHGHGNVTEFGHAWKDKSAGPAGDRSEAGAFSLVGMR